MFIGDLPPWMQVELALSSARLSIVQHMSAELTDSILSYAAKIALPDATTADLAQKNELEQEILEVKNLNASIKVDDRYPILVGESSYTTNETNKTNLEKLLKDVKTLTGKLPGTASDILKKLASLIPGNRRNNQKSYNSVVKVLELLGLELREVEKLAQDTLKNRETLEQTKTTLTSVKAERDGLQTKLNTALKKVTGPATSAEDLKKAQEALKALKASSQKEIDMLTQAQGALEAEKTALKGDLGILKQKYDTLDAKMQADVAEEKKLKDAETAKLLVLETRLSSLAGGTDKVGKDLLEQQITDLKKESSDREKERLRVQGEYDLELKANKLLQGQIDAAVAGATGGILVTQAFVEGLNTQIRDLNAAMSILKGDKTGLEAAKQKLDATNLQLAQNGADLQTKLTNATANYDAIIKTHTGEITRLQHGLNTSGLQIETLEKDVNTLTTDAKKNEGSVAKLQSELAAATAEIEQLRLAAVTTASTLNIAPVLSVTSPVAIAPNASSAASSSASNSPSQSDNDNSDIEPDAGPAIGTDGTADIVDKFKIKDDDEDGDTDEDKMNNAALKAKKIEIGRLLLQLDPNIDFTKPFVGQMVMQTQRNDSGSTDIYFMRTAEKSYKFIGSKEQKFDDASSPVNILVTQLMLTYPLDEYKKALEELLRKSHAKKTSPAKNGTVTLPVAVASKFYILEDLKTAETNNPAAYAAILKALSEKMKLPIEPTTSPVDVGKLELYYQLKNDPSFIPAADADSVDEKKGIKYNKKWNSYMDGRAFNGYISSGARTYANMTDAVIRDTIRQYAELFIEKYEKEHPPKSLLPN